MGQGMPTGMGNAPPGSGAGKDGDKDDPSKKKKKRFEPRPTASAASRNSRRRRRKGPSGLNKTPTVQPNSKCKLRLLKLDRVRGMNTIHELLYIKLIYFLLTNSLLFFLCSRLSRRFSLDGGRIHTQPRGI